MQYDVQIRQITPVTHNVIHVVTDKPKDYDYRPGQATMTAIDKKAWREKERPFTFTGLPDADELEFTVKVYEEHNGVTEKMDELQIGDALRIGEPWGAIDYSGPGTFIAGGAGVTPFLAIFKKLAQTGQLEDQRLVYANKTVKDIIHKRQLNAWLGENVHHILSQEKTTEYDYGHIDAAYLKAIGLAQGERVYLCGPPPMMDTVKHALFSLGISEKQVITEDLE